MGVTVCMRDCVCDLLVRQPLPPGYRLTPLPWPLRTRSCEGRWMT